MDILYFGAFHIEYHLQRVPYLAELIHIAQFFLRGSALFMAFLHYGADAAILSFGSLKGRVSEGKISLRFLQLRFLMYLQSLLTLLDSGRIGMTQ